MEHDCQRCGHVDELRVLELETEVGEVQEIAQLCPSCCRRIIQDIYSDLEDPVEQVGFKD